MQAHWKDNGLRTNKGTDYKQARLAPRDQGCAPPVALLRVRSLALKSFLIALATTACTSDSPPPRPSDFNAAIVFTTSQESSVNPATACSGEPTYSSGIAQIPEVINPCLVRPAVELMMQDTGANLFLHSGESYVYAVDLEIPGRGFNWTFARKYRSGIIFEGALGNSWEFNYNRRIIVAEDGDVERLDGYGRSDTYALGPDGNFLSPRGFYTRLVKKDDGEYVEYDRYGASIRYSPPDSRGIGVMTHLVDRHGNAMEFQYGAESQLSTVVDTLGRLIHYRYNDEGRLIEVEDFAGRLLQFEYDDRGDLVSVTGPPVTGTSNDNDFPSGKTTRYTYSSGFEVEALNHNLLTVTAPNEAASSGVPFLQFEYDDRIGAPTHDRVTSQTFGGVNGSGLAAGGGIFYQYRDVPLEDRADSPADTRVEATVVTDRNGNETEYLFDSFGNIVQTHELSNRGIRPNDPQGFSTTYGYNVDGEVSEVVLPQGDEIEYVYDDEHLDRLRHGNLLTERRLPDSRRANPQDLIETSYVYEPVYNQLLATTEARGNDANYIPANGDSVSAQRYTRTHVFDYQEAVSLLPLAERLGIAEAELAERLGQAGMSWGLGDVNGDGNTNQLIGNPIMIVHPAVTLRRGEDPMASVESAGPQEIVEVLAYNSVGQLERRVDPEGNVTVLEYYSANDPDGDGSDLIDGIDERPAGYLRSITRDSESDPRRNSRTNPPPVGAKTVYEYDRVGNVTSVVDGRGVVTRYEVNQLNQIVQITRAADVSGALRNAEEPEWSSCTDESLVECTSGMTAFGFRIRFAYDHNDNTVSRELENVGQDAGGHLGRFVHYGYAYDILDDRVQTTVDVSLDPLERIQTNIRYDRNQNPILELTPIASLEAGSRDREPTNVFAYVYDERDLVFTTSRGGVTELARSLRAHGAWPELVPRRPNDDVSHAMYSYDLNGNLHEAIDSADNTGDGELDRTSYIFDGYDRQFGLVDALGNEVIASLDPAGNVESVNVFGSLGGESAIDNAGAALVQNPTATTSPQQLLTSVSYLYDEMSRLIERRDRLFAYSRETYVREPVLVDGISTEAPDGWVVTRYGYDRSGRRSVIIEDDGGVSQTEYDGLGRAIRLTDPKSNEVRYRYDDNGNIVELSTVEVTDVASSGQVPVPTTQTYQEFRVYDSLNRLIRATDNIGQTERWSYDSRDNLVETSDAQHSAIASDLIIDPLGVVSGSDGNNRLSRINRPGNTVQRLHDGVNRIVAEIVALRSNGYGKNALDHAMEFNPDGLIITDYDWDANSRLISVTDDGSTPTDRNQVAGIDDGGNATHFEYDAHDRLVRHIYPDNAAIAYAYDADNNISEIVDQNGSIIRQRYDGLNRLTRVDVTRAPGVIGTSRQTFEYDGLSRPTRSFDDNFPELRTDDWGVTYAYDSMSRLLEEVQDGLPVSSQWDGAADRRLAIVYPDGRRIHQTLDLLDRPTIISDARADIAIAENSYAGPSRAVSKHYSNGANLAVAWDAANRIVQHRTTVGASVVSEFEYEYDRNWNQTLRTSLHDERLERIRYDSAYRMTEIFVSDSENQLTNTWEMDGAGNWTALVQDQDAIDIAANELNQYTRFGTSNRSHDANGNVTDDGRFIYEYDFANRLRRVSTRDGRRSVAAYHYDAHGVNDPHLPGIGRQVRRELSDEESPADVVTYYHDLQNVVEERRPGSRQQYVYDLDIDYPISLGRDLDADGVIDETYFYHLDASGWVVALTSDSGEVVERVTYDPYGRPTITDSAGQGAPNNESVVDNQYLFAGRRYDPESGLYYYRSRHFDPIAGRFLQRDPLGIANATFMNFQNPYTYVENNPVNMRDPLGLAACFNCVPPQETIAPGAERSGEASWGEGGVGGSHSNCLRWETPKLDFGPAELSALVECCQSIEGTVDLGCLGEPGVEVCLNCSVRAAGQAPIVTVGVATLGISVEGALTCIGLCVNDENELKSVFFSFSALQENCEGCLDVAGYGEATVKLVGIKCTVGGRYCIDLAGSDSIAIKGECCGEVCWFVGCSDWCPVKLNFIWKL